MKIVYYCFVFGLFLLMSECEMLLNKPDEVLSADITDAIYLGIDRGNDFDSDLNAELQNNLVKFTSGVQDGEPVSVEFHDESGEPIRNALIYAYTDRIAILSQSYTVIWGDFRFTLKGGDTHSNALLLDHETGTLTDLVYEYHPNITNSYLGSKYHQQDQYGNIYYLGDGGIRRLLVQDPANIQVDYYMDYSPVDIYFVDLKGNVFFQSGKKVKLATGG